MKRLLNLFTIVIVGLLVFCFVRSRYAYSPELEAAISTSTRPEALKQLLKESDKQHREALEYLITYMPEADRDTMSLDLLKENVEYAFIAYEKYPWTQALPKEVFYSDVLPYYVVDEVRDSWRRELYELFAPVVDTCTTLYDALCAVNRCIPQVTGVDYNTRREKTNQSPRESMRQGMASCTGLSILLIDAYRSVGIPARFVGTASWHDNRGNHSWTEVWLDGKWRVTEYYFPSALDNLWFMADAAKANPDDRRYAIYATRFGEAPDWFPMVWCAEEEDTPVDSLPRHIGAENVTQDYIDLALGQHASRTESGTHTQLSIAGYARRGATHHSEDRVVIGVDIFAGTEQMGGGLTAGPLHDMNDLFTLLVPKNASYELRYSNKQGEQQRQTITVGNEPVTAYIYLE